ncbi:hypothetical protein [Leptolyngbya sp. FACHB-261]|nr:hypothetical protein [Leptolyngbya sp. FACHB-261]MBD2100810.1 hypothetical protein [Leptolyngbya sp. FACHB-261]
MKTKWMIYKELELIPDSVPEPQSARRSFTVWLSEIWQLSFTRPAQMR